MTYQMYETQRAMLAPWRAFAAVAARSVPPYLFGAGHFQATYDLLSRAGLSHLRPAFGIDAVEVGGRRVAVRENKVLRTPFATLLHFRKHDVEPGPRVLLIAPLSGHFATLLRNTVETMLPEHDVYLTDWHNARDIEPAHGRFGLDEYVEHVIGFLGAMGEGAHVVAICQAAVPALAAVAVMAEAASAHQPRSMTLMAGPIDGRCSPTVVNELAEGKPIEYFNSLISSVPWPNRGAGRKVYPGFLQVAAFMNMNPERHLRAHRDLYDHLVNGEHEKAATIKKFYDEYFAVLDLTAEFYLETVRVIFQEHALARGEYTFRDRKVSPKAIKRTALLTVEGENDDICGLGQTLAAHELCSGLRPHKKRHHLQAGSGHYGVFSGWRWQQQIYPAIRNLILAND